MKQGAGRTGLAALAVEAHTRREKQQQEEHERRLEARRRELEQAAQSQIRTALAVVDLRPEQFHTIAVEAEPFDGLGGTVRLEVDGVPILYEYEGTDTPPTLALMAACPTCGQHAAGDSFTDLPSLGEALTRPSFIDPERHTCKCSSSTTAADSTLAA